MKKTLLALSVATIAAAPVAHADSQLTGSLRYGLTYSDPGNDADSEVSVNNYGSRIKWSGDTDLGNGMTAIGKLELRLNGERNGNVVNRLYYVGVKGGFGEVTLGTQDSAYDLATFDDTWWFGGGGLLGDRNEKEGVIKYKGSFGDVTVAVAAQMLSGDGDANQDVDDADIVDAAVKYDNGTFTVGAAVQSKTGGAGVDGDNYASRVDATGQPTGVANTDEADGTVASLLLGYDYGAGNVNLTLTAADEDYGYAVGLEKSEATGVELQLYHGNFLAFYNSTDLDKGNNTPFDVGIGYTQSLGPQTLIWYELVNRDPDTDADAALTAAATLKYDF